MRADKINNYLYFSYVPEYASAKWLSSDILGKNDIDYTYSIEESAEKFNQVFDSILEKGQWGNHIVPLSGGYDSRAILGALLKRVNKKRIKTFSFGAPGQLDFEIGKKVARKAGVSHVAINLEKVDITWDKIKTSVKESPWTYVPDGFFNKMSQELVSEEGDCVWSGFLGDNLAGSHMFDSDFEKEDIFKKFILKQKRSKSILHNENNHLSSWTKLPKVDGVCFDDFLDLYIRQSNCIAPIVTPLKRWDNWGCWGGVNRAGAQVVLPFADLTWASYCLFMPREKKQNQKMYLDTLHYLFPDLFSLPGKESLGVSNKYVRKLKKKYKKITKSIYIKAPWLGINYVAGNNYLDFDKMFRKRKDYKQVLKYAFNYLEKNEITPWLDFEKMEEEHMNYEMDHGGDFLILIGLAANLEASNE